MTTARIRSANGLNLREKPNGEIIDVLRADEEVTVFEKVTFFRVKTSSGKKGYVHGDYLEKSPSDSKVLNMASPSNDFPSPVFELVQFSGGQFVGEKAMVDKDFIGALSRVNTYAASCGVKIWVTSSTRNLNEQVRGAIVEPASKSCHHVGHAIDMNLQCDGEHFNSKKLKKSNLINLPEAIRKFIIQLRQDEVLRWGGDFTEQDPVHIDDNLYRRQETIYLAKLQSRLAQLNA